MAEMDYKLNWRTGLVAGYLALLALSFILGRSMDSWDFSIAFYVIINIPSILLGWVPRLATALGDSWFLYPYIINIAFWYFVGWMLDRKANNKKLKA